VQNLGTAVYHLLLVENLKESGWKDYEPLAVPGMNMTRESWAFRIYETELSASGGVPHSHPVPAVVVLVSGEANTAKKHLDKTGRLGLYFSRRATPN
jgi:hypothetical protein